MYNPNQGRNGFMKRLLAPLMIILVVLLAGCDERAARAGSPDPNLQFGMITTALEPQTPPPEPLEPENIIDPFDGRPLIALTFDDGPSHYTDRILDLLEEHGGAATFFVLGYRVEGRAGTIARAFNMGSEIAGHSWLHPRLIHLSEAEVAWQIQSTSAAIKSVTGSSPPIFRPPFGQVSDMVMQVSGDLGYSLVNWTIDTRDWENRCADAIYDEIMRAAEDGGIVLMHDIYASTIEAMERVIPRLIEDGYKLVTVSELLRHVYGDLEPGTVYGRVFW